MSNPILPRIYLTAFGACLWALLLLAFLFPAVSAADAAESSDAARPSGLMWNRSGLPAVFPLQVKTPAGRDYFLTLVDQGSGEEVLAAYIVGGTFFKVLVPPGVFALRFASGVRWQGEAQLFGPGADTKTVELADPLTFGVLGSSTKAGHLVDLTETGDGETAQPRVKGQYICQTFRAEFSPPWEARNAREFRFLDGVAAQDRQPGFTEEEAFDLEAYRRYWTHALSYPHYALRSRFCD